MNDFIKNNKLPVTILGAVVLIVVIGSLANRGSKSGQPGGGDQSTNQQASATPTPSEQPKPTTSGTKALSYEDAIKKYPNRFQFISCHATPGSLSVAAGTAVMLDNRDQKAHTIKVGSISTYIKALGYSVIYPKTKGDLNITCDGGGAGTLKVN